VLAFSCFHRSTADPRGCDCLQDNLAFAVSAAGLPTAAAHVRAPAAAVCLQRCRQDTGGRAQGASHARWWCCKVAVVGTLRAD
jgi:hypothetical protein